MTDAAAAFPDLLPARMLNEFVHCPRLFYLEYVQGEWEDSSDTEEGRFRHRVVDKERGELPAPGAAAGTGAEAGDQKPGAGREGEGAPPETIHARSVLLSAPNEGLIARIDLVEGEGDVVTPVDYKKGSPPDNAERCWPPERVQLCAQGLILRENGYRCDRGVLYFATTRQRVEVPFTGDLVVETRHAARLARAFATALEPPPPLADSPKCPRCSLVGICLPDETRYLAAEDAEPVPLEEVRRLLPARDDALPMYVQVQGGTVGIDGERLVVKEKGSKIADARLLDVSQLVLVGNVQVSTQALRALCDRDVPISYLSYGNRFCGITHGMSHKNVQLRMAQFQAACDSARSLKLAKRFVEAKVRNARTLLRRNHAQTTREMLSALAAWAARARRARDIESLLGVEGMAGRDYFANFAGMLKLPAEDQAGVFDFEGRNRRPPKDPVNALLSLAYTLLAKDWTVTLLGVGFDPYLGFYHRPHYGRPALALDLMEEFRPIVADSVVIAVLNNGEVDAKDFIRRGPAVMLTAPGRKRFIQAYERRMDSLVTHPVFKYRVSYRRILEVQARLLGRYLLGEIPDFPMFRTR